MANNKADKTNDSVAESKAPQTPEQEPAQAPEVTPEAKEAPPHPLMVPELGNESPGVREWVQLYAPDTFAERFPNG